MCSKGGKREELKNYTIDVIGKEAGERDACLYKDGNSFSMPDMSFLDAFTVRFAQQSQGQIQEIGLCNYPDKFAI